MVVIHELGACCIKQAGEVKWSCDTDVVTGFTDEAEVLRLTTDEGEITISKKSGAKL